MVLISPDTNFLKLTKLIAAAGISSDDARPLIQALVQIPDDQLSDAVLACESDPTLVGTLFRNFTAKRHALETNNTHMWDDILEAERAFITQKLEQEPNQPTPSEQSV